MREGQTTDSDRFRLLRVQLQRLLRLRQHVQTPRAQFAVRRDTNQIVRVLRPDDAQAVHRMLRDE